MLASPCSCRCPIHWSKMLSREWRCSWSSADRRCSNYIWVINNFIAYSNAPYIRGLRVVKTMTTGHWFNIKITMGFPLLVRCHLYIESGALGIIPHCSDGKSTHLPLGKMAATWQMPISNTFPWMKMYWFWLRFPWSLFPMVQLTIFLHCFR